MTIDIELLSQNITDTRKDKSARGHETTPYQFLYLQFSEL